MLSQILKPLMKRIFVKTILKPLHSIQLNTQVHNYHGIEMIGVLGNDSALYT